MKKIFISAYACEPHKGSEPGIGWNVVNRLSWCFEVHVLTRANNREVIEAFYQENPQDTKPVFHYYDLPKWLSFWKKKRRGYRFYYYLWQYFAFFKYRKFVNTAGFDLVQHLTFANFSVPSLFMFTKPVTVYGPIGAAGMNPAVFRGLPLKIKLREAARKVVMWLLIHCDICRFLTPFAADCIIECGEEEGKSAFPRCLQKKIIRHPQTGISLDDPEYRTGRKRADDGKIRLLICSEFIHWKGVTFACEVFCRTAKVRSNVELVICGTGPEEKTMRRILEKGNVLDRAVFRGFISKQEMFQELCDADILLYPSYHHGLATLILQAMYAGLPIVCIKGDPVALAVSEGAGMAADGRSLAEILDDLSAKTLQLVDSPELRRRYGAGGHQLAVERYDWQKMCTLLAGHLEKIAEEKR